jgi:hypothetical protein
MTGSSGIMMIWQSLEDSLSLYLQKPQMGLRVYESGLVTGLHSGPVFTSLYIA